MAPSTPSYIPCPECINTKHRDKCKKCGGLGYVKACGYAITYDDGQRKPRTRVARERRVRK